MRHQGKQINTWGRWGRVSVNVFTERIYEKRGRGKGVFRFDLILMNCINFFYVWVGAFLVAVTISIILRVGFHFGSKKD